MNNKRVIIFIMLVLVIILPFISFESSNTITIQSEAAASESIDTFDTGAFSQACSDNQATLIPGVDYLSDELIVVFNPELLSTGFESRSLSSVPLQILDYCSDQNLVIKAVAPLDWGTTYLIVIPDDISVIDKMFELTCFPEILRVQLNFIYHSLDNPMTPDDPLWENPNDADNDPRSTAFEQFGPSKAGTNVVWGESGNEITGDGVVVAVLDSGVNYWHQDLNDNMWRNPDEIEDNFIDDDNNGYVDDTYGWDFIQDDANISNYSNFHGTSCAGVIAAETNTIGCASIAPDVKIMGLKTSENQYIFTFYVLQAIQYAINENADIISMSWGGVGVDAELEAALNTAYYEEEILLLAAAGNSNSTIQEYPARFNCVISVGATITFNASNNPIDEVRITPDLGFGWEGGNGGSNYGSTLEVMGFGERYITTSGLGSNDYDTNFGGTSCACPMAAGVLALLISAKPDQEYTWYRNQLKYMSDDLYTSGFDTESGYGRVNAIRACYGPDRYASEEDGNGFVELSTHAYEVYDSLSNVSYVADINDKYKITTSVNGELTIDLDIFTWGENLDIAVYSHYSLSPSFLIDESTGANHYYNSSEQLQIPSTAGSTYFIKVSAPNMGDSTSYGLSTSVIEQDPCIPDNDPPTTDITNCSSGYGPGVTQVQFFVVGEDPNDCTSPSNLDFYYQKKLQSNPSWPGSWIGPDDPNIVTVTGLYAEDWDVRIRAVDEEGNEGPPDYCSFTIEADETPCDPDDDPPGTSIVNGCGYHGCGTTGITVNVSGSDPNNCTSPSNLDYEWQIKEVGDSWPGSWNYSNDSSIEVNDLMSGEWEFRVRAVDEAGNRDGSPASCPSGIIIECPPDGDLNCSGCVDLISGGWPGDVQPLIQRWHDSKGDLDWDNVAAMADCAGYDDGYIDVNDIINVGIHWKEGC